jgi:hypothetical protein
MLGSNNHWRSIRALLLALGATVAVGLTGCQSDFGGQTLPSPYYLDDDVQYFPPGPQMKLSKEAAALKTYNQEAAANQP